MKTMVKILAAELIRVAGAQPALSGRVRHAVAASGDVPTYRAITHRPTSSAAVLRWVIGSRQEERFMPIATPEVYAEMLGQAKQNRTLSRLSPPLSTRGHAAIDARFPADGQ